MLSERVTAEDIQKLARAVELHQLNHVLLGVPGYGLVSVRREQWEREPQPARLGGDATG
ncbi:MAG: hypothetical protein KIS74_03000 [Burkholderiales bacterium]|nr:hypothetical protein [Burkholderiales bacterium]